MDPEQEAQPIMQVSADIRRGDLAVFNLYMFSRMKAYWVFFVVVSAFAFFGAVDGAGDAAVFFAGMVLTGLAYQLFKASDKNGQLGTHVFTLRKDGLHQQTPFDETLNRWRGIYSIIVWKHALYIRINWYLVHIIPARAFTSRADFDRFSSLALELWTDATKSP
jgi:hypothetical protein